MAITYALWEIRSRLFSLLVPSSSSLCQESSVNRVEFAASRVYLTLFGKHFAECLPRCDECLGFRMSMDIRICRIYRLKKNANAEWCEIVGCLCRPIGKNGMVYWWDINNKYDDASFRISRKLYKLFRINVTSHFYLPSTCKDMPNI